MKTRITGWSKVFVVALLGFGGNVRADDVWKEIRRLIPPAGIEVKGEELAKLRAGLAEAERGFAEVRSHALAPDAEVFFKAVKYALGHGEFYGKGDIGKAEKVLAEGVRRVALLKKGEAPWTKARGLVVRGYRSEIDGSAQPYGVEIPEGLDLTKKVPVYVWLHGRGDKETDVHFIAKQMEKPGQFRVEDGIVVQPFGRQCIGWKSAGEIDVLDVVDEVDRHYGADLDRVALMGFSMGGAGAWHLGAHYTDRWAVVHAGAGFAETARYTNLKKEDYPSETEQLMWRIYDVPNYARNLLNVPVVAYSGEVDKQMQAALVMEEALKAEGLALKHVIGAKMGHKYSPEGKAEVLKFVRAAVAKGRNTKPAEVHLQTRTLRYPSMHWVKVTGMVEPYEDTRVDAVVGEGRLQILEMNASAIEVTVPEDISAGMMAVGKTVLPIQGYATGETIRLVRGKVGWELGVPPEGDKKPGLQGPIDDAFLEPFLVVVPDEKPANAAFGWWVEFEVAHLVARWRGLFRGDLRVKKASEVTEDDVAKFHLIAFGDGASNAVIGKALADEEFSKVLEWGGGRLILRGKEYDAEHQVPILVQPNPMNRNKYLVINSGPTFREKHDRTNSLQNPKLGDWAVIDLTGAPDGEAAGKVVASGVFNSGWE